MKTTPTAARRLLREGNPVPADAFPDAARDGDGPAVLASILASPVLAEADAPRPRGRAAARTGWPALRTWKVAVPAGVMTAALAGLVAVTLTATSQPPPGTASPPADSGFATLIANLTARPPVHPGDAAAALRQLAAAAARQPAVPLGPVEYSEAKSWNLDLDRPLQYDLNYVSHETSMSRAWMARDGSFLGYFTVPGGKYQNGSIPLQQNGPNQAAAARFAWYDPAKLPADATALRAHLLHGPDPRGGSTGGGMICSVTAQYPPPSSPAAAAQPSCHPAPPHQVADRATDAIVFNAENLMEKEPLPPAVRASLLRLLADSAARGLANANFIAMGTVTDRAGHAGVAIGYKEPDTSGAPGTQSHLEVLVFDPATGALLGDEDAYCKGTAASYPVAGSCTPEGYDQLLQVKAVQAIPPAPKLPPVPRWTPTTPSATPPPASASSGPPLQSSVQQGSNP